MVYGSTVIVLYSVVVQTHGNDISDTLKQHLLLRASTSDFLYDEVLDSTAFGKPKRVDLHRTLGLSTLFLSPLSPHLDVFQHRPAPGAEVFPYVGFSTIVRARGEDVKERTAQSRGRGAIMRLALAGASTAVALKLSGHVASAKPLNAARLAQLETDPESALELWDGAVLIDGGTAVSLGGRGLCLLILREWARAERDLTAALAAQPEQTGDKRADAVQRSLLFDGLGLARLVQGNFDTAKVAFSQALGELLSGGASDVVVPEVAPFAGLRGGAFTMAQRVSFHKSLAIWGADGAFAGAAALAELQESSPAGQPQPGYPQFWEARAAYVAALWTTGDTQRANGEWSQLCQPAPEVTPTDPIAKLSRNSPSMLLLDAYSKTRSQICEDIDTGYTRPCDKATIPGLGEERRPCFIFTPTEVRDSRLWPGFAVDAFQRFLKARGSG